MLSQRSYESQVQLVRDRGVRVAKALWLSSPSYRDADVDRLVERLVPLAQAGQVQIATLTAAYLGSQNGELVPVDQAFVTDGRGVPAVEVYRRPAVAMYTALAMNMSVKRAVEVGAQRLVSIVQTDFQMAKVRQSQSSLAKSDRKFYRRVLTGRENCALCVIASTQKYSKADLMPIHPGCDCGVATIPSSWNPNAMVLDQDLLDLTHDAIASKLGGSEMRARDLGLGKTDSSGNRISDYTDLIVTREHGEYGPTLSWRDDKFTSADDIWALAN